jgi:glycolate oxidase iron-sulfur subunit
VGCGFNFALPRVSESTVEVLGRTGAGVQIADNCCCGLPAYGYGDLEAARKMARKNMDVLEKLEADVVVTECGSCSAFLKNTPNYFGDPPPNGAWLKEVMGFSEFMQTQAPRRRLEISGKAIYHDPCHLSRYQGITKEPRPC